MLFRSGKMVLYSWTQETLMEAILSCPPHPARKTHNTVGFFSTALLQEHLDATGTPGTQGGLLIYTPAQGKALCPPGIGQSAGTLICMHPLGRGWRQIRASTWPAQWCCLLRLCTGGCLQGWPQTQKSTYLCLPSARIKGMQHHCLAKLHFQCLKM